MSNNRVGRTPSVEEALRRLTGEEPLPVEDEIELTPPLSAVGGQETAGQLSESAGVLGGEPEAHDDELAPERVIAAFDAEAEQEAAELRAPLPELAVAPAPAEPVLQVPAEPILTPTLESPAPAPAPAPEVEVVSTDQLLEALRASGQQAVRRLAAVPAPPSPAAAGNAAAGVVNSLPRAAAQPGSSLPGITELSKEVERAVVNAVAAASYHQDVEHRASAMASNITADAAAEAQRTIESANAERSAMLASVRAESKEILADARVQRDAIIARATAKAEGIVEQAQIELARQISRIGDTTGAIADVAETALSRLGAGTLTGEQLAQFVAALTSATERIVAHEAKSNK